MRFSLYFLFLIFTFSLISLTTTAQINSRSGFSSPMESRSALRMFPCGGETIFDERMSGNSIPADWQALDLDMEPLANQVSGTYQPGWQSLQDFKDPTNRVLGSPSWYADTSKHSNDWLITPLISLDTNICLSWYAYSQDVFYAETYEVRISTANPTPDSMGFLANDPLLVVNGESYTLNYRSVNLSDYDGKDVYIAFRHTSKNSFVLVLDDVRLGKVKPQDLGAVEIEAIDVEVGDSTLISAALINYGSETIRIDSLNPVSMNYHVDGGPVFTYSFFPPNSDTLYLIPNDTARFTHDVFWKPTTAQAYYICMWPSGVTDDDISNDTTCIRVGVGVDITAVEDIRTDLPISVYPNPVEDRLSLEWEALAPLTVGLFDIMGSKVMQNITTQYGQKALEIDMSDLSGGIYLVKANTADGQVFTAKIVKR